MGAPNTFTSVVNATPPTTTTDLINERFEEKHLYVLYINVVNVESIIEDECKKDPKATF